MLEINQVKALYNYTNNFLIWRNSMSEAIKTIDEELENINIFDPELMACPHSFFKKLRDEAPVYQDPATGIFQVSKHELICKVARDAKLFSNQFGVIQRSGGQEYPQEASDIMEKEGFPAVDTMLTADPPRHTRYRSLVDKAFSPKRVSDMGPDIEEKINYIIDQFYDDGKCEVCTQISQQLPIRVIAELLGVPLSDYESFSSWLWRNWKKACKKSTRQYKFRNYNLYKAK